MGINNYPQFPKSLTEGDEREIKPYFEESVESEDTGLTLYFCVGRIFVYAVDDGFYLMPKWATTDNISALFDLKSACITDGYYRGYDMGKQEERKTIAFYAKLINGKS